MNVVGLQMNEAIKDLQKYFPELSEKQPFSCQNNRFGQQSINKKDPTDYQFNYTQDCVNDQCRGVVGDRTGTESQNLCIFDIKKHCQTTTKKIGTVNVKIPEAGTPNYVINLKVYNAAWCQQHNCTQ